VSPKRLVLLVEGEGDMEAAPVLIDRLLKDYNASNPIFDVVFLDHKPFRVGEYSKIRRNRAASKVHDFSEWRRLLQAAVKSRTNVGGCVLLLDGDSEAKVEGKPFCAARAARILAAEAQKVGAGKLFSLAIVFACMEFESWLIAGAESLVNKTLSDGRQGIKALPHEIPADPEKAPRDAKGWFRRIMTMGYKPTRDQVELAQIVDIGLVRDRKMRSFRRLESAVGGLIDAIRAGSHVVTPAP
jgi:hypothetical protein